MNRTTASHRSPTPARVEPLEGRLLCKISLNGEFVIAPPGGGEGHSTIHVQPEEGLIGLRTARERSNGVVNWQITSTHQWTPANQALAIPALLHRHCHR